MKFSKNISLFDVPQCLKTRVSIVSQFRKSPLSQPGLLTVTEVSGLQLQCWMVPDMYLSHIFEGVVFWSREASHDNK